MPLRDSTPQALSDVLHVRLTYSAPPLVPRLPVKLALRIMAPPKMIAHTAPPPPAPNLHTNTYKGTPRIARRRWGKYATTVQLLPLRKQVVRRTLQPILPSSMIPGKNQRFGAKSPPLAAKGISGRHCTRCMLCTLSTHLLHGSKLLLLLTAALLLTNTESTSPTTPTTLCKARAPAALAELLAKVQPVKTAAVASDTPVPPAYSAELPMNLQHHSASLCVMPRSMHRIASHHKDSGPRCLTASPGRQELAQASRGQPF